MLVNNNKKLIWYHPPRTGGTTLSSKLNNDWKHICDLHPEMSSYTDNGHLKQRHLYESPFKSIYEDYQSFCVARNPWDRILSCYLYVLDLHKKYLTNKDDIKNYEWSVLNHNKLISNGFLNSLKKKLFFNTNFTEQCSLWMQDGKWFKLEEKEKLEEFLEISYDIKLNGTSHSHYSFYYDDETRDIISELYKDDIEKFNYHFEEAWKYTTEYRKSLVCDPAYFNSARNNIGKYVINLLKPEYKVLDFGCGVLRIGLPVIKYLDTNNYYGFDISEYRLLEAKQEVSDNNLLFKNPKLTHKWSDINLKFDFIWCYQVFIHVYDEILDDILSRISNSLKDDGVCIASINISDKYENDLKWLEFPFVCRPYSFYDYRLRSHGLKFEKVPNWGNDSPEDGGERLIKITKI